MKFIDTGELLPIAKKRISSAKQGETWFFSLASQKLNFTNIYINITNIDKTGAYCGWNITWNTLRLFQP